MSDEAGKIPKPKMQGLLRDQIRRSLIVTFLACATSGLLVKIFYCDATKKRYAEFYKNYDIYKEFNRIRRKGLFDSCDAFIEDEEDNEDDQNNS